MVNAAKMMMMGGGVAPFTYKASAVAEAGLATLPAVASGDLIFVFEYTHIGAQASTPVGWTLIDGHTESSPMAVKAVMKISDGTETGTINLTTDTTPTAQVIVVFTGVVASINALDTNAQATGANAAAQVKNASTIGTAPKFVIGFYAATGAVSPRTFTGDTADQEVSSGGGLGHVKWKFYSAGGSDITIDMDDEGLNGLLSAIIEVT